MMSLLFSGEVTLLLQPMGKLSVSERKPFKAMSTSSTAHDVGTEGTLGLSKQWLCVNLLCCDVASLIATKCSYRTCSAR